MTFRFKLDFPAFSVKQGLNHHSLPVGCCITGPGGEGDIFQGIPGLAILGKSRFGDYLVA